MAAPSGVDSVLAKLCSYPLPRGHHPLHLGIRRDSSATLCQNIQEGQGCVLALIRNSECFSSIDRDRVLFTNVDIVDPGPSELSGKSCHSSGSAGDCHAREHSSHDQPVVFLCSQKYLKHYQFFDGEIVRAKLVTMLPPLSKVVLAFNGSDMKNSDTFCRQLLLSVCQHHKILMREGDVLLPSYLDGQIPLTYKYSGDGKGHVDEMPGQHCECPDDVMHVIECYPTQQGMLTVKTEIVVVDSCENVFHEAYRKTDDKSEPFLDSLYLSDFSQGKGAFSPRDISIASGGEIHVEDPQSLQLKTLEHYIPVENEYKFNTFLNFLSLCDSAKCDEYNTGIVTLETAKKWHLFNGSLVILTPSGCKSTSYPDLQAQSDHTSSSSVNGKLNEINHTLPNGIMVQVPKQRQLQRKKRKGIHGSKKKSRVIQIKVLKESTNVGKKGNQCVVEDGKLHMLPYAHWHMNSVHQKMLVMMVSHFMLEYPILLQYLD